MKYKIFRYYGGEFPDDIVYADTMEKAEELATWAEHADIEINKNK